MPLGGGRFRSVGLSPDINGALLPDLAYGGLRLPVLFVLGGWRWGGTPEKSEAGWSGHDGGTSLDAVPLLVGVIKVVPFPSSSPCSYRVKTQILSGLGGSSAAGIVILLGVPSSVSLGWWCSSGCLVLVGGMVGARRPMSLCGRILLSAPMVVPCPFVDEGSSVLVSTD